MYKANENSRALATALYNTNKSFRICAIIMYNTRTNCKAWYFPRPIVCVCVYTYKGQGTIVEDV